jgi:hypothetical protein
VNLRKRNEPSAALPEWIWQEVWVAVISAYSGLRRASEPELLRSLRVCESTIEQVQSAASDEEAEALSTDTLGTRSGPLLVRAIRSGHPDIVRAKLLEDFHRTLWPEALALAARDVPGDIAFTDAVDSRRRDELEALCFKTLRRFASDDTWDVVVESAAYDTDTRPEPQFAEVLRRRA